MRVLVVTNPRATGMSVRQRDVLAHAVASAAQLEVAETENRGHAAALACRAMRNGTDVVVALGGDGTVNEVINGLLTDGVHAGVPALGIVPAGSTNVFVRALGLPNDPIEATGSLLEGLRSGRRRPVSMGLADERYFCSAAGFGFDAAIVHGVERKRRQGKRSTHALYTRVGLVEFLKADRRHPKLHVELPDGTRHDAVHFAIVANADPWTYVGSRPLRPTPDVSLDSGLAVYARRRMRAPGMLWSMARMSGNRPHVGVLGAHVAHDLDHITLIADEPLPFQVDGDAVDTRDKVTFRSVPAAIAMVGVPPDSV
ncbi:MAG: diacylglycerol/lipid kinase family protein [Jatrophihabitans sp.]